MKKLKLTYKELLQCIYQSHYTFVNIINIVNINKTFENIMATETTKKPNRQQLAKVVELDIAPARTRRFFDKNGINRDVENKLTAVKAELMTLRKAGGPSLPTPPESPKKDSDEQVKEAYKVSRANYDSLFKKYNDYKAESYTNLERVYNVTKTLQKIADLLIKSPATDAVKAELKDHQVTLRDECVGKRKNESDDSYEKRVEEFTKPGYAALVDGVNLDNVDSVRTSMNNLRKANSQLDLFFKRDLIAKERTRFNDAAAVALATAMQLTLEELVEFGIKNTRILTKKIIQPDHCVRPGIDELNFYPFFANLPPLKALVDRQQRREQWAVNMQKAKHETFQTAKSKAKKAKKKYEKPEFKYPTFTESEVSGGHACMVDETDDKGVTKSHCRWYGIDVDYPETPTSNDSTNFHFYISQVCKRVMDHHVEIGDSEAQEIRFSTNLRKFFSDLIVAFISRISPQIRILIDAMDVKTINHNVIKTVLRQMLVDGYHSPTGIVDLTEDHKNLFTQIDEKVKLCQDHHTAVVSKPQAENDDSDDEPTKPAPVASHETTATEEDASAPVAVTDDDSDDSSDEEGVVKTPKAVKPPAPKAAAPKGAAPKGLKAPAKPSAPKSQSAPKAPTPSDPPATKMPSKPTSNPVKPPSRAAVRKN
jgi:hypothetical protein